LTDQVKSLVVEESINTLIKDPKRQENLIMNMENARNKNADRDWVTLFSFKEVVEAAVHFNKAPLSQKDIDDLAAVRNNVFHAASKRLMVESCDDIRRLKKVRNLCLSILDPEPTNN
jgi:hypothetical protein